MSKEPDWDYAGKGGAIGPDRWCDHWPHANGLMQSPVEIKKRACESEIKNKQLEFHYTPFTTKTVPTKTVKQLSVLGDGGFVKWEGKKFLLRQIHLHQPVEHIIPGHDASTKSLEIHLVHEHEKSKKLAVVGIIANVRDKVAKTPVSLIDLMRAREEHQTWMFNICDHGFSGSYYTYHGSLTTPPCDERVTWFVLTTIVPITKSQYQNVAKEKLGTNRPVQSLNVRKMHTCMGIVANTKRKHTEGHMKRKRKK